MKRWWSCLEQRYQSLVFTVAPLLFSNGDQKSRVYCICINQQKYTKFEQIKTGFPSKLAAYPPQRVVLVQTRRSMASLYKMQQHPPPRLPRLQDTQTMTLQCAWKEHEFGTSGTHQSTGVKTPSSLAATRAVWLMLLTPFESGRSPLAWLDAYRLTYPPSSLAIWLYRKKEQRWRGVR